MTAQENINRKKLAAFGFICLSILLRTTSTMCAKQAGLTSAGQGLSGILFNPWYWGELIALGCHALSWTVVLRIFSISFAYPFMSVTFLTILWGSWFFFNEPVYTGHLVGVAIIVLGVLMVSSAEE